MIKIGHPDNREDRGKNCARRSKTLQTPLALLYPTEKSADELKGITPCKSPMEVQRASGLSLKNSPSSSWGATASIQGAASPGPGKE